MKTFSTSGTGSQQTLSEIESEVIPTYSTEADADADLSNLEDEQIFGVEETSGNTEGTQYPVNVVESGNMHSVTSNAVFENCLDVETVTGTTDVGGGTYIIKKVGKIVTLDIFGCSLPTGTLYTLFTIPQRFRCPRMIIAQGFNGSGSVDRTHMLGYVIDQNGEVNVNTSDMPLVSSFPQLHTIWIID